MINNVTSHNNANHSSVKPQTVMIKIKQLKQYEPLFCQSSNCNGQQYNNHKQMNHSSLKPDIAMVDNITSRNNINHPSVKLQTVMGNNITSNNNMTNL
jgi:hypothetical protein